MQELMAAALAPLNPNEKLETLQLSSALTFQKILDRHQLKAPPEISLSNRIGLNLTELMSITAAGLDLMKVLDEQDRVHPRDYLKSLEKHLSITDQDGDTLILTVNSLGYAYCNVEISLNEREIAVEENCD